MTVIKTLVAAFVIIFSVGLKPVIATEMLSGKIWDSELKEFLSFQEFLKIISSYKFILIGERHGRSAHQNREAFILAALAEKGKFPDLYLEMLYQGQNNIVAEYREISPEYTPGLAVALKWYDSNWPAWRFYQPVFDMAFAAKLKIRGADIQEDRLPKFTEELRTLRTDSLSYYSRGMRKAHCGLISEARVLELAERQILRDQAMASALLQSSDNADGAVLIAGSSHTRISVAIPSWLPEGEVVSIALRETILSEKEFLSEVESGNFQTHEDYRFVWFTPKSDQTSFCDKLKN